SGSSASKLDWRGCSGGGDVGILLAMMMALADPATLTRTLDDAGMPRSATVLLAALASDAAQPEDVRAAAKDALVARAAQDPALGMLLLAQQNDPGKLPPALAVAVARGHLEAALQLAPPEEGVAFAALDQGPL